MRCSNNDARQVYHALSSALRSMGDRKWLATRWAAKRLVVVARSDDDPDTWSVEIGNWWKATAEAQRPTETAAWLTSMWLGQ